MSREPLRAAAGMLFLASLSAGPGCRPPSAQAPSPDEAASSRIEAERLEASGRWLEAARVHEKAALQPRSAPSDAALQRAVIAYLMADRTDLAHDLAARILERDPDRVDALYYVGEGQRVLMKHDEAAATLRALLEKDPRHRLGALSLGRVLLKLGAADEALPRLDAYLEGAPADDERLPYAKIEKARALRRLGKTREACDLLGEVLASDPYHMIALAEAAQAFAALGRKDIARGLREEHSRLFALGHQVSSEDESKLHASGGDGPAARARKALEEADRRRFLPALRELERLRASQPGDGAIALPLARLWLRLGRPSECIAAIRTLRSSTSGPLPPEAALLEADALVQSGDIASARSLLREASAALPGPPAGDPESVAEVHARAGFLELEPGGDLDLAGAALDRARAADPSGWKPLLGKARLAIARGDGRLASSLAAEAEQRGAPPRDARLSAAEARGMLGDLRFAARELMDLIRSSPHDVAPFASFERVFGSRAGEPEVSRVLELARAARERREARDRAARALAARPFDASAPEYLALGKERLGQGDREGALDALILAGDLDPGGTEALDIASGAVELPRETFLRIHLLRRILARSPGDGPATGRLEAAYLELGPR